MSNAVLQNLASRSPRLLQLYEQISAHIVSRPPFSLGYPGKSTQSSYYPGPSAITEHEITEVSRALQRNSILPENTRLRKAANGVDYEVLIASVQAQRGVNDSHPLTLPGNKGAIRLVKGDHSAHLEKICGELSEAAKFAANNLQRSFLNSYIESLLTGDLEVYRQSQRDWVRDKAPRVENIFGFVEPYRDPHGIRSEFEGLVAIADDKETEVLLRLVKNSDRFISRLPWTAKESDGKGPFEKTLFEPPDFSSIHCE